MAIDVNPSLMAGIGSDGLPCEAPIIAFTEKFIEVEKIQLRKYIEENYSKIRDVKREFDNLNLELDEFPNLLHVLFISAFEHLIKKIEVQNEKILAVKIKEEQAKKVWKAAVKVVKDEEAVKLRLGEDLNNLVQESSNSQYTRLEELKRRLEALNPRRTSTSLILNSTSPTGNAPSQGKGVYVPTINVDNQQLVVDGEGQGKKKSLLIGKGGKGVGASPKGRGPLAPGWTGAGFDVDSRS
ncbi:hypothetical protein RND81_05G079900 [Saponaria officinalis]|uniref:FRIGIDA-like protein n=1 Tax=Saponaria officinalis TaxID=3572 RepID=A0AAW1KW03_SAPOF